MFKGDETQYCKSCYKLSEKLEDRDKLLKFWGRACSNLQTKLATRQQENKELKRKLAIAEEALNILMLSKIMESEGKE